MTDFEIKLNKQQKVIKRIKEKLDSENKKLDILLKECPHDKIEEKSEYFSGSYTDKASTTRYNQCCICGATSEKITEVHSYYG